MATLQTTVRELEGQLRGTTNRLTTSIEKLERQVNGQNALLQEKEESLFLKEEELRELRKQREQSGAEGKRLRHRVVELEAQIYLAHEAKATDLAALQEAHESKADAIVRERDDLRNTKDALCGQIKENIGVIEQLHKDLADLRKRYNSVQDILEKEGEYLVRR